MGMKAGAFGQPVLNQFRLVRSIVVHDEVNVQFFGHVLLDSVEEVAELHGAMALLVLSDDLTGLVFEYLSRFLAQIILDE